MESCCGRFANPVRWAFSRHSAIVKIISSRRGDRLDPQLRPGPVPSAHAAARPWGQNRLLQPTKLAYHTFDASLSTDTRQLLRGQNSAFIVRQQERKLCEEAFRLALFGPIHLNRLTG